MKPVSFPPTNLYLTFLTHWGQDKWMPFGNFADDIFKCIFFNENVWIPIKISLKFVPKGPINNIPAIVQIMAWRRPGDKPLSEPMVVSLQTHICVAQPQWVKWQLYYMHVALYDCYTITNVMPVWQILVACHLFSTKSSATIWHMSGVTHHDWRSPY